MKRRHRLVAGILVIRVVLEALVSVHDGVLKLAANGEGVTHYGPLQNTHTEFCISQQMISRTRRCDLRRPDAMIGSILPVAHSKWPLFSQHRG